MARLRCEIESNTKPAATSKHRNAPTPLATEPEISPPPTSTRRRRARHVIPDDSDVEESDTLSKFVFKGAQTSQKKKTQIRLAPRGAVQSSLGGISSIKLGGREGGPNRERPGEGGAILRAKSLVRKAPRASPQEAEVAQNEDFEEEDVEESIWCGSDSDSSEESEEELPSMRKFLPPRRQQEPVEKPPPLDLSKQMKALTIFDDEYERKPKKTAPTKKQTDLKLLDIFDGQDVQLPAIKNFRPSHPHISTELSRPGSSSDKENAAAIIRFSPPRNSNPIRSPKQLDRPSTPPQSLSKSRLKSPSKPKTRIPTPPHRQSLDAFWAADTVNEWNDHHSPKKILKSPQKFLFQNSSSTTEFGTPPISPLKLQSPSKAETASRKQFIARREDLAKSFLAELDEKITQGRVGELAASTGGVQLVWSKTLTSTAGRANWRRETTRSRDPNSSDTAQVVASTEKHFATIELATKVIDDEDRLLNVLAHEFCHLANFMVSGIKDQPHGKSFKQWGAKATKAFGSRGVEVTTKHTYAIDYKYVWVCGGWDGCGTEFKRHSKSIDVQRHRCGVCKGDLIQVKPVPRGAGKSTATPPEPGKKSEKPAVTGYAAYVKLHFASVKKGLPPGSSHKDAMQALSRKYQAEKAAGFSSPPLDDHIADVAEELKAVKLGDSLSPINLE